MNSLTKPSIQTLRGTLEEEAKRETLRSRYRPCGLYRRLRLSNEGVEHLFRYAHDKSRLAVITQGFRRHSGIRRNRNALAITETELRLMAALAIMGLSTRPNTG